MGFYPKGAPSACYLKHAGTCFQESICVVVFWSQRGFVGGLLQAHGVRHEAVLSGRWKQASLPATERQKAAKLIPVSWPNKMSPGNGMLVLH